MSFAKCFASIAAFAALTAALTATPATANTPVNILQAGASKGERVAFTGVTRARENGVWVYRGRKALLGAEETAAAETFEINITVVNSRRPPARLRTQGFYSGVGPSYPFTQGFYSGGGGRR